MARLKGAYATALYGVADQWRKNCLTGEGSILWPGEHVWSKDVLTKFKEAFTDRPDESNKSFEAKFERQLHDQSALVTKLACELLLVYFLFTASVRGSKKRQVISTVAGWKDLQLDEDDPSLKSLDRGMGGTGQAYNARRPFELSFIATFALRVVEKPQAERSALLSDHLKVRELLDEVAEDSRYATRHTLLHLLFPEHYERIASQTHKEEIAKAFEELAGDDPDADLDDRLATIRKQLAVTLTLDDDRDFYREPLRSCWLAAEDADDDGGISPFQALSVKRQIVLFGPPGTGKTHEARSLAETVVRQAVLRAWKPKRYFANASEVDSLARSRVRRLQLHPGYGYEDLVRGVHLVEGGRTDYRPGALLGIIEQLAKEPDDTRQLPFVVILDEMNRSDLSKVLGEFFTLLEDRDGEVQLAGQGGDSARVSMPSNVFFIGTMNLIDQSLEQIDFALRRRFFWFFRGFKREDLLAVAEHRWRKLHDEKQIRKSWDYFAEEFETLAARAEALNRLVREHRSLGRNYEIGHTYFCDVVAFAQRELEGSPGKKRVLFNKSNVALVSVTSLWDYSLQPLIEQYLTGVEEDERKAFVDRARDAFLEGDD